jgi:8-oxo-dGTP pyrophosphatase MutT (NUDIX family)
MKGNPRRGRTGKTNARRELSAGGLIWRRAPDDNAIEVVLVRPAGRDKWVLPKGHVEQGESVLEAALREATEETGLQVVAGDPLGDVAYVYSRREPGDRLLRIFKRVHFFLMQSTGGDPSAHDGEIDEVRWFPLDEALSRSSHRSERELIEKARDILNS